MEHLLAGVQVLDLTRVLAGPYASMVLADLGAEVIKIELPGTGDEARGFGPFQNGESAYFASVNRGKKSVTIDLRQAQGQDLARRLAGECDVLIENFRPGSMDRFGLGYAALHALYPRLVYASISGFGQTGPYAQRPAYDVLIQAMGGLASITGQPDGPPVRVGSSIADLSAALFGAIGILAALERARRTGEGQQVDISMLDCQVALLENALARYARIRRSAQAARVAASGHYPFPVLRRPRWVHCHCRGQRPALASALRRLGLGRIGRRSALCQQCAPHREPRGLGAGVGAGAG